MAHQQWHPAQSGVRMRTPAAIDIHELLKRESLRSEEPKMSEFHKRHLTKKESHGISDIYIDLDSFSKVAESRVHLGEFIWRFMIDGVTSNEAIGIHGRLENIIEIQIGEFTMPILEDVPYTLMAAPAIPTGNDLILQQNNSNATPTAPTLVPNVAPYGQYPPQALLPPATVARPWINNPYSQIPYGVVTLGIKDFGTQSYSGRENVRHQFEFMVSYPTAIFGTNPNMIRVAPRDGEKWDSYIFTDPLKDMYGVTLVFRNPDIPIRFLPDIIYNATISSDSANYPAQLGNLIINAPGHKLNVGDRIYIEFANASGTTGNNILDRYLTQTDGQVVAGNPAAPLPPGTPIVLANPDVFYLDPLVSLTGFTRTVPVFPQIVNIRIAKRRIRIPMRLRKLVDRDTNHISI